MISHTSKDANYWRERAALIRTPALTAKDQATLDLMCDLAGDCDKFADKAALKAHADKTKRRPENPVGSFVQPDRPPHLAEPLSVKPRSPPAGAFSCLRSRAAA